MPTYIKKCNISIVILKVLNITYTLVTLLFFLLPFDPVDPFGRPLLFTTARSRIIALVALFSRIVLTFEQSYHQKGCISSGKICPQSMK